MGTVSVLAKFVVSTYVHSLHIEKVYVCGDWDTEALVERKGQVVLLLGVLGSSSWRGRKCMLEERGRNHIY